MSGRSRDKQTPATTDGRATDEAQRNFTDPQSSIMVGADGFVQAYNAQLAVDEGHQIITLAAAMRAKDQQALGTAAQTTTNIGLTSHLSLCLNLASGCARTTQLFDYLVEYSKNGEIHQSETVQKEELESSFEHWI